MGDTLLFAMFFLAVAFAWIGLTTQHRIYNIFSAGAILVLTIELSSYTALVVVFVGMIIYQLWYATLG